MTSDASAPVRIHRSQMDGGITPPMKNGIGTAEQPGQQYEQDIQEFTGGRSEIINWTRYLFYGADVTDEGLQFFEETLNKLLSFDLNLAGYFHVQSEDGERNFNYQIIDGDLKIATRRTNSDRTSSPIQL